MTKSKNTPPITQQVSPAYLSFLVDIDFEGKTFQARCEVIALTTHDKFRCKLIYNDLPPHIFGMYSESTLSEAKADATREFREYIANLPNERRIPSSR